MPLVVARTRFAQAARYGPQQWLESSLDSHRRADA